jgi:drug/metabolite transporter (DMT)-like permease
MLGKADDAPLLPNDELVPSSAPKKTSVWFVHGVLASTTCVVGLSAVVLKLGMAKINPVLFALLRDVISSPLLIIIAFLVDGTDSLLLAPSRWTSLLLLCPAGVLLFVGQFMFVVAAKISSPVTTAAWQPITPIFTCILATMLGVEKPTVLKTVGIALSVGGALFMCLYSHFHDEKSDGGLPSSNSSLGLRALEGGSVLATSSSSGSSSSSSSGSNEGLGNILLLIEVIALSVYVLYCRSLLVSSQDEGSNNPVAKPSAADGPSSSGGSSCTRRGQGLRPCTVTAYSYLWAAVCMWVAGLAIDYSEPCYNFVCGTNASSPGSKVTHECPNGAWGFPASSSFALAWYILVVSIGSYSTLNWANQYVEPSKTLAYNAVQPVTSALLCWAMIEAGWNTSHPSQQLSLPSSSIGGAALIMTGLGFLLYDTAQVTRKVT